MACRRNFAVFNAVLGKAVCLSGNEELAVYDGCQQFLQGSPENPQVCASCGCHEAFHLPFPSFPSDSSAAFKPVQQRQQSSSTSSTASSPRKRKLSNDSDESSAANPPASKSFPHAAGGAPIPEAAVEGAGEATGDKPDSETGENSENYSVREDAKIDYNSPRVLNFLKPFKPDIRYLQCPICLHCFLNNGNMNSHFMGQRLNGQHMTEGVMECYFCGRVDVGSNKDELFKHMILAHMDDPSPYSCYKCRQFKTTNKSRLSGHVKRCSGVSSSASSSVKMTIHSISDGAAGGANSAWVPAVRQPPTKRRRRSNNVSEDDEDQYDMGISSEDEEEEDDYNYDDFEIVEPAAAVVKKKTPVIMTRETFLSQFTPGGYLKRQIQCPTCLYCYSHEQGLEVHMIHHLQDSQLECYFCSQIFPVANSVDLLEHMVDNHLNQHNPFSCTLCDQWFGSKAAQVRHYSRHRKS